VVKDAKITWPPPPPRLSAVPKVPPASGVESSTHLKGAPKKSTAQTLIALAAVVGLVLGLGVVAPPSFMGHFTVFVLAIFVGWQVVWNVTPALHTPLMSVTNAISGIIVIGALLQMGSDSRIVMFLAALALLVASINVFGGFWVTQRMLRMFRRES
ncbi:MAG: proton-translocating transhydrogenase family protein, partial [Pseudomonadota bacterium]